MAETSQPAIPGTTPVATSEAAGPDSTSDAGTGSGGDWRAPLAGELRRVADKFTAPAEVVKSYAELEKRLGRSVTLPGRDADEGEIAAFYARLGRPETPEGYDLRGFTPPQPFGWAPQLQDAMVAEMHAAGLNGAQVRRLIDRYARLRHERLTGVEADTRREVAKVREDAEAAMRRDWGADYDATLARARRAMRHFGGDGLDALMEETGLGNDPAVLRAFACIGREMAEDGLLAGGGDAGASVQERIDRIMAEHFGKPSYTSQAVQDELRDLYEALHGTGPARPDAA